MEDIIYTSAGAVASPTASIETNIMAASLLPLSSIASIPHHTDGEISREEKLALVIKNLEAAHAQVRQNIIKLALQSRTTILSTPLPASSLPSPETRRKENEDLLAALNTKWDRSKGSSLTMSPPLPTTTTTTVTAAAENGSRNNEKESDAMDLDAPTTTTTTNEVTEEQEEEEESLFIPETTTPTPANPASSKPPETPAYATPLLTLALTTLKTLETYDRRAAQTLTPYHQARTRQQSLEGGSTEATTSPFVPTRRQSKGTLRFATDEDLYESEGSASGGGVVGGGEGGRNERRNSMNKESQQPQPPPQQQQAQAPKPLRSILKNPLPATPSPPTTTYTFPSTPTNPPPPTPRPPTDAATLRTFPDIGRTSLELIALLRSARPDLTDERDVYKWINRYFSMKRGARAGGEGAGLLWMNALGKRALG